MRLLLVHADAMSWKPEKKAIKAAESPAGEGQAKDALVAFCAVEKADEQQPAKVAEQACKEILDVVGKVKAKAIVLYPYAHLSSSLSSPGIALRVLLQLEQALREHAPTQRAPFGWYKSFSLQAKGHPLAELSKSISAESPPKKTAPPAKIVLDRSALPKNDHRVLGEDLKIFSFADEVGAGLPLWLPAGEAIRFQLEQFMREQEEKAGYQYVRTPHITKGTLYEASGHLPYYKDSMYAPLDIEGLAYYLKPMNCPHHHMIFRKLVQSYRDLPLRLAEAGMTYRNELSGVTYGLIRTRCFTQNDAHLYVAPEQLRQEFRKVLELFDATYRVMGLKGYWFRLSLPDFAANPDKFTGDPKAWEHACEEIRAAMKEHGAPFGEEKGEAAFYGPKIDVQIKNTLGKEETIATSQVDIVVPQRMGLTFVDQQDRKQHVVVIHRAILGSYERFLAYLLEQTGGALPFWLSPVQVRVAAFTDRNAAAAAGLAAQLREEGFRAQEDCRNHTVEYKVREAELLKVPYVVVVGDKEEQAGTLAVRTRGEREVRFGVKREAFLAEIRGRREKRT